jgi:hypothetical protein
VLRVFAFAALCCRCREQPADGPRDNTCAKEKKDAAGAEAWAKDGASCGFIEVSSARQRVMKSATIARHRSSPKPLVGRKGRQCSRRSTRRSGGIQIRHQTFDLFQPQQTNCDHVPCSSSYPCIVYVFPAPVGPALGFGFVVPTFA